MLRDHQSEQLDRKEHTYILRAFLHPDGRSTWHSRGYGMSRLKCYRFAEEYSETSWWFDIVVKSTFCLTRPVRCLQLGCCVNPSRPARGQMIRLPPITR